MKTCPHCNIEIVGKTKTCPLCQNDLRGECDISYWPSPDKLKKKSVLYKVQMFIMLTMVVLSLGMDFLFEINDDKHWSLMVCVLVVMAQLLLRTAMRKRIYVLGLIAHITFDIVMFMLIWGWYMGGLRVFLYVVIPIILWIPLIVDFIFSFIDKKGNAMAYLLMAVLCGVVPNFVFIAIDQKASAAWSVIQMASVIALIAAIVFNGRKVLSEIQKRMAV